MDKSLLASRTVWAAAFVAAVIAALGQFGITISAEQATMVSLVMAAIMRKLTRGAITSVLPKSA